MQDKPAEYAAHAASDWTGPCPSRRAWPTAPIGRLKHHAHRTTTSTEVTRADLATFLVEVPERCRYIRSTVRGHRLLNAT